MYAKKREQQTLLLVQVHVRARLCVWARARACLCVRNWPLKRLWWVRCSTVQTVSYISFSNLTSLLVFEWLLLNPRLWSVVVGRTVQKCVCWTECRPMADVWKKFSYIVPLLVVRNIQRLKFVHSNFFFSSIYSSLYIKYLGKRGTFFSCIKLTSYFESEISRPPSLPI
jgi:hypothetical protein